MTVSFFASLWVLFMHLKTFFRADMCRLQQTAKTSMTTGKKRKALGVLAGEHTGLTCISFTCDSLPLLDLAEFPYFCTRY